MFRASIEGLVQGEVNRYRRKRPKVDASIFDSALSHIRRSDASKKKEKKIACPLLGVSPVDKFRVLACIGLGIERILKIRK